MEKNFLMKWRKILRLGLLRIHWSYGIMTNEYYGWKIQKLIDKNSKIFIFHRVLILLMSTGKSVSTSLFTTRPRWTGTILCPPI